MLSRKEPFALSGTLASFSSKIFEETEGFLSSVWYAFLSPHANEMEPRTGRLRPALHIQRTPRWARQPSLRWPLNGIRNAAAPIRVVTNR